MLVNAFSPNMLPEGFSGRLNFELISLDEARELAPQVASAVGHADTATLFSAILDTPVEVFRMNVELMPNMWLLLGQYRGPRLPEGATSLPEGASIAWYVVSICHA